MPPSNQSLPTRFDGGQGSTAQALRALVFGSDQQLHTQVRTAVLGLADAPQSGLTYAQEAAIAPALLRDVTKALGGSGREIAADVRLRGLLCEWAAIAAPRLLPVLTGHFDLAMGAILALGDESAYQQAFLAELDTADSIGVLLLTELGGTNGNDQQTTATWDATTGGFWLSTPTMAATKFMPNVADPEVPKITVVTARLVVNGTDEGVLPFLLKLRTPAGLADGVRVVALPDKVSAQMDHAMIRFDRCWVPREALLGGDLARITPDGELRCALAPRNRFHAAISVLGAGRLDLANAAAASARAALAGLVNYSRQRRPGTGTLMADRDAVQLDLVPALAAVYATSVLGRRVRDMRAAAPGMDPVQAVLSMLAKPLLSYTAHGVLMTCRQRAAAQGSLRINYLLDWIGNLEGILTAEGENQIMQITAGKAIISGRVDTHTLQLPGTPAELPWWIGMLAEREQAIAAGLRAGNAAVAGAVLGPDSAAIEMATATAERLAATALASAAYGTGDPVADELGGALAAAYALGRIGARGSWYAANGQLSPLRAAEVQAELSAHQATLAQQLPALVAAFDIPTLPGPIFTDDYVRTWQDYAGWADELFPQEVAA